MKDAVFNFIESLKKSLDDKTFVKVSFGNYKGDDPELKRCLVRRVMLKAGESLSFTYRYKTRDIIKNYDLEEGTHLCRDFLLKDGFGAANLFTTDSNIVLEQLKNESWKLKKNIITASCTNESVLHDRQKKQNISTMNKPYLHLLKVTDEEGNVYKKSQNKFKQINHYIELLSTLLDNLPASQQLTVLDMGAGKGYLTFALYDYLQNVLKRRAKVIGVEYREDLVKLCNQIAELSHFEELSFQQGMIHDYKMPDKLDVLIALHACDTATDDAIYKGIKGGAELIVVAPCCQKQIRKELERNKAHNELDFMTKHGIYLERHAEMLTDSMRALLMEQQGYSTRIFEFISDSHTPKNILLVGQKRTSISTKEQSEIGRKIERIKSYFGVSHHHLERLLEIGD